MAYYENISLEKGMYSVPGKSFSQVLEELDSRWRAWTRISGS